MGAVERKVARRFKGQETLEGAGVRLRRQFSNQEVKLLDPFLLLDNFGSTDPDDYLAGFPWHPHRGIETVTYMLSGTVEHGDTLGNAGKIGPGEVQWMRSGGGIIHQEMPQLNKAGLSGFQLWINMPSKLKLSQPAYHGLSAKDIPVVDGYHGSTIRVVAGSYGRVEGPIRGGQVDPLYLDITLPKGETFEIELKEGYTVFAQTLEGSGAFDSKSEEIGAGETILYDDGAGAKIRAGEMGLRFLLVSGKPLQEPIAWYGPMVMNTEFEIQEALLDLKKGQFLRHRETLTE